MSNDHEAPQKSLTKAEIEAEVERIHEVFTASPEKNGYDFYRRKPAQPGPHPVRVDPQKRNPTGPTVLNFEDEIALIEEMRRPVSAEPPQQKQCAENCELCSGESCEQHGQRPCDCDTAERHMARRQD